MTLSRRALLLASAASVLVRPALAQGYPERQITVIVPFAAGGPTDIVARIVSEHMSRTLGQQLIVENVGGAGGTTGMVRVAQAAPDGYTVGVGNMGTQTAAPALYPNLKYDPAKSFDQIGVVNNTPMVIIARKETPAKDLGEFIAYLKANIDKISAGHAGVGSISHVAGTVFNAKYGLKPGMVAYRGVGPALIDLVAGQIDYIVDQSLNVIPQIQSGTIKVYAIAAPQRLESLPNVPTTREAGSDFVFGAWNALVGPKGLPNEIVDKLVATLGAAIEDPDIIRRFVQLGSTSPQGADRGPAGLQRLVEREVATITPILKATGVTGN